MQERMRIYLPLSLKPEFVRKKRQCKSAHFLPHIAAVIIDCEVIQLSRDDDNGIMGEIT